MRWIFDVYRIPEKFLIASVGLDGVMLLRFFRMATNLFGLLSLFGLFFVIPSNFFAGSVQLPIPGGIWDELKLLKQLTVQNVPQKSPVLKLHLLFTWIFSFIVYSYLIRFFNDFVRLKLQYQEYLLRKSHFGKIDMRSIMVYGIPKEMQDEVDLTAYFESLNIGKVETAVICRKYSQLQHSVWKRGFYLRQLETVHAKSLDFKRHSIFFHLMSLTFFTRSHVVEETTPLLPLAADPTDDVSVVEIMEALREIPPRYRIKHRTGFLGLFGPLVDSATYYAQKFKKWDQKVQQLRKMPEFSMPTAVGFVTFESPESAAIASQINIASKPFVCMTRQAPEPRDLYWPNISSQTADPHVKLIRSFFVYMGMFFMVFFSTIAVSAIASIIDLETLAKMIPGLKGIVDNLDPISRQFIQGVIPTAVLALWTSGLPSLLLLLSQFQGLEAQSWIEMAVMSKYFFYQIWNILLVVVSSTVFKSAAWPINSPKDIIEILGNSLPQESPTLINYVILQAFTSFPAQLLLVGPLILTWITRLAPWSRGTARQVSDAYYPSTLTSINYGIAFSVPILIFVIGIIYAAIAPLILLFCFFFFVIGYCVFKYLLLYVHIPRYETGGMFAAMAVRRCLFGVFLMQLTMMGVLALKSVPPHTKGTSNSNDLSGSSGWSGYVSMVLAVMPLLVVTIALFWWFKHGYEKEITHIPMDLLGRVGRSMAAQTGKEDPLTPEVLRERISKETASELQTIDTTSASAKRSVKFKSNFRELASPTRSEGSPSAEASSSNHLLAETMLSMTNIPPNSEDGYLDDYEMLQEQGEPRLETAPSDENITGWDERFHLEPPQFNVPGVLDASLESLVPVIPNIDEELSSFYNLSPTTVAPFDRDIDLSVHTYLHPALIGRLPVAWLQGRPSQRIIEAREEQVKKQVDIWRRVVGRQRLGVRAIEEAQNERVADFFDETSPRGSRRQRIGSKLMSFVEGFTSWVHLQMS